ncbi:hypothetical protein [Pedobacter nutrimenti]|uniref:hypothetical protein n=1 Tax=Pedobacter nutrimenti TaxID=1241337 RepID=UPI00292EB547|nr:hypothetical protein [Pedobacter nutrimenti]
MKYILLLIILLPFSSYAQRTKSQELNYYGTSIYLKDAKLFFRKMYKSKLNEDQLGKELNRFLSSVKNFKIIDTLSDGRLTGELSDHYVKVKEGAKLEGITSTLKAPMHAYVSVEVKNKSYMVIVSGISFKIRDQYAPVEIPMAIYKRNEIRDIPTVKETALYLDSDLMSIFDINSTESSK